MKTNHSPRKNERNAAPVIMVLIVVLIAAAILSLTIGRYGIKLSEIAAILKHSFFGVEANYDKSMETVLYRVRIPRIFGAIFVGAALSVAGATYQGLFRNPMVSPDLLGASSGAGFGAAIALLMNCNLMEVQVSAFVFGIIAVGLTFTVSTVVSRGSNSTLSLVLTGVVVGSLFSAFITIVKYLADPNSKLAEITFWLMGGLNAIRLEDMPIMIIPITIGIVPVLLMRYNLNVLSFGEEEAQALGMNTKALRGIFIVCATLMTTSSVSVSGRIGWVGLVVPHFARMIVGPNYQTLMPVSMLLGSIYMLLIDNISRCLFVRELPLSVMTALVGAPFFLYLLMKGKKGWV